MAKVNKWKVVRGDKCAQYLGTFYRGKKKYYHVVYSNYSLPKMYFSKSPFERYWKASECTLIKEPSKLKKILVKFRKNMLKKIKLTTCAGLDDPMCENCKRFNPDDTVSLVKTLAVNPSGRKSCIYYC